MDQQLDIQEYLRKPIDFKAFIGKINQVLELLK